LRAADDYQRWQREYLEQTSSSSSSSSSSSGNDSIFYSNVNRFEYIFEFFTRAADGIHTRICKRLYFWAFAFVNSNLSTIHLEQMFFIYDPTYVVWPWFFFKTNRFAHTNIHSFATGRPFCF
jgi:hypothetical protein